MDVARRSFLAAQAGALAWAAAPAVVRADEPFRFALTPVFLDNDAALLHRLQQALSDGIRREIAFTQRRTYQEITGALLDGSVDAAWLCGYPYLQHREDLSLLGVPVWRGEPLYRSYLIVAADDPAASLLDLAGATHAFSDPDSNSGYLVTASDLARVGTSPDRHFARTIFTYGHRNVVRSVAGGLTRSGSVDGYVWEALTQVEPDLTARTKVIARSELLGFPPFVARRDRMAEPGIAAFGDTLLGLSGSAPGREALALLFLDGVTSAGENLFDGIAGRMAALGR